MVLGLLRLLELRFSLCVGFKEEKSVKIDWISSAVTSVKELCVEKELVTDISFLNWPLIVTLFGLLPTLSLMIDLFVYFFFFIIRFNRSPTCVHPMIGPLSKASLVYNSFYASSISALFIYIAQVFFIPRSIMKTGKTSRLMFFHCS